MSVGKLNQAFDLVNGKRRPIFVDVLDALAHVIAVHNPVRQDARTAHDGPPRDLAGNLLDQFASRSVYARMCVLLWHSRTLLPS
jgi:hypothetical protein